LQEKTQLVAMKKRHSSFLVFRRKENGPSNSMSVASLNTEQTRLGWVDEEWERTTKSSTYTFGDVDTANVLQLEEWARHMLARTSVVDDPQFTGLRTLQDIAGRVGYTRDTVGLAYKPIFVVSKEGREGILIGDAVVMAGGGVTSRFGGFGDFLQFPQSDYLGWYWPERTPIPKQ